MNGCLTIFFIFMITESLSDISSDYLGTFHVPSSHLCNIPISYSVLFMFVFPSLHIILPIQTISRYRKTNQFLIIFSHWFKQNLSIFNLLLCWGWHLQLPIFVINVFWINVKYSCYFYPVLDETLGDLLCQSSLCLNENWDFRTLI